MTDSERPDLDAKRERNRRERLEGVRRWANYIREHPPEVWGPQQNAIVNGQLESARETGLSAEHHQRVREIAADLTAENDGERDDEADE